MAKQKTTGSATRRAIPDLPAHPEYLSVIADGEPIEDARIVGVDLSGQKIRRFDAKGSVFEGVSWSGCELVTANFRDCRLVKCDLSNAILRGFQATRVEFIDCRLVGMAALECRWQDVLVERCEGRYLRLTDGRIRAGEFKASNFAEADLRGVDLEGATFAQVDLRRADLSRAKLLGTDLRGAEIEGMIVGQEDVRGAIVNTAQAMDLARLLGLMIK